MSKLPKELLGLSKGDLESMCVNCGLCLSPDTLILYAVQDVVDIQTSTSTFFADGIATHNCCYASAPVGKSSVFIPELRCKHLKFEDNKSCCSVYEDRQDVAKGWCLPLVEAIEKGVFPKACPYVRDVQSYVGSVALPDEQYEAVRPLLQKALEHGGKPEWVSDSLWKAFLDQT